MSDSKLIEGTALSAAGLTDGRLVQELTERGGALRVLADHDAEDVATAVVPAGHGVVLVDTEQLGDSPARRRGTAAFTTLEAFARYVNAHRGTGTTVWVSHDPDNLGDGTTPIGSIVGVIDDHDAEGAGWGEHDAKLPLVTTPQWRHWLKFDKKYLTQDDFSEHLRQGLAEIAAPDAATVLEVVEHLTVTESATLTSVVRTGGDLRVEHQVEQTGRSGGGSTKEETEIPEVFTLRLAPFAGAEPVEIKARLKYRNAGGTLALGYTLERPLEALTDAVSNVEHELKDALVGELGERVYRGAPISRTARQRSVVRPVVQTV